MVPLKIVCSFVLALLVPIYISAQGTSSSPAPTSLLPDDGNTSFSTDDSDWTEFFSKMLSSALRHLAEVQNSTDFSTEACAANGNTGPCFYTHLVYLFMNGNETCSVYTVGNCDDNVRGYTERGCTHQCKLMTVQPSSTENPTAAVP